MNITSWVLLGTVMALPQVSWAGGLACPSLDSDGYYFQPGAFRAEDDLTRAWYSSQLRAMQEPSMWCGGSASSEYRFTWLRTFHHPIAVRVTQTGSIAHVEAIELDGAGGYEPGNELRRVSRPISTKDWLDIKQAIEAWTPAESPKTLTVDGSEWIFERRTLMGYSAIAIQSPASGTARSVGLLFLAKAGIIIPLSEVY